MTRNPLDLGCMLASSQEHRSIRDHYPRLGFSPGPYQVDGRPKNVLATVVTSFRNHRAWKNEAVAYVGRGT